MAKSQRSLPGLRRDFSNRINSYTMIKPFGPSILETYLPENILQSFLILTDDLLNDPNRKSHGKYLVGQIQEEPLISNEILRRHEVFDYLKAMFAEYVLASASVNADPDYQQDVSQFQASSGYQNPVTVDIQAAWLVSQKGGEYNPIHNHSGATLSSVLYLKVPEKSGANTIPNKVETDGDIEFVEGSTLPLQNATVRTSPEVGKFLIFPSYLLHLVYPFQGEQERRSVSINASHQL